MFWIALVFNNAASCLLAAGRQPSRTALFRLSRTRLDDLDDPGAGESDSCHENVKLAFPPLNFLEVSLGGKLSVWTLWALSKHLAAVYGQTAHLRRANLTAEVKVTFFRMSAGSVSLSAMVANEGDWEHVYYAFKQKLAFASPFPNAHSFFFIYSLSELVVTGILRNTYQVFGSWGVGAQPGQWDEATAFLCCWGDCLS